MGLRNMMVMQLQLPLHLNKYITEKAGGAVTPSAPTLPMPLSNNCGREHELKI